MTRVASGLHQVSLRGVNAFLLADDAGGLVMIDAGFPTSADAICSAVRGLGHELPDVRHILVTHSHGDHTGSLARLRTLTGARTYMHQQAANLVAKGRAVTHLTAGPGLVDRWMHRRLMAIVPPTVAAVDADVLVNDGDLLPFAGGIEVIHTPGHSPGHVVFLARKARTMFLGDAAANVFGLRPMVYNGDHWQAGQSLRRLGRLEFEVACVGHGSPIRRKASNRFRHRWKENR
ncbi:MAG: MBL fold metallo-hydrolase [Gemmatimonadales bacterium]|nr:MAG: MBL fold metallo-hydrolase [Gemmatimonadales bacterium]